MFTEIIIENKRSLPGLFSEFKCIGVKFPSTSLRTILIAGVGLIAASATAQTFTTAHHFVESIDGGNPYGGVTLVGNTLFGTTVDGGAGGFGTIFRLRNDGTGFTNCHDFINALGSETRLVWSDNYLYGISFTSGEIFRFQEDGSNFTNLYRVTSTSDTVGLSGLTKSGDVLFGTTDARQGSGGAIFRVGVDGVGFTNIYIFSGTDHSLSHISELFLIGDALYGVSHQGGTNNNGFIFKVNTDGTGFTNLHNFPSFINLGGGIVTNSGGARPYAGLILSGNTFYGTTRRGGVADQGTVFSINADGTGFRTLHMFSADEGSDCRGALRLLGDTLYGTASKGGAWSNGTVFCVATNGSNFQLLHAFSSGTSSNIDGAVPMAGLEISGDTLFGTTIWGGTEGNGTIFNIKLSPRLITSVSNENLILGWPTNFAGYTLQFAEDLVPPAQWTTDSHSPAMIDDRYLVKLPIDETRKFYRLAR